ncbi:MAG: GAF domain-containing protein, partial [Chitinophagaceae bacterium]
LHNGPNEEGQYYMRHSLSGMSKEEFEQTGMLRSTEIFDHTFRGKGTIRIDDISIDPHYKNLPCHNLPNSHLQIASYLAVPVISSKGEILGGLFFGHNLPRIFTKKHEVLAEQVAIQAAIALENANSTTEFSL